MFRDENVIVATMPVRNESWILGCSARAALMFVDGLVILDHASTDETPQIIAELQAEYPDRVIALRDDNPEWQEMRHRQLCLDTARAAGATHILLIDADEVLSGNLLPHIRDMMPSASGVLVQLPWACLARSIDKYYIQGPWFNNWVSTAFVNTPNLHWTSAGRGGYDFHHRHPMGVNFQIARPIKQHDGGLMHLQFVSERRVRAKACLYQMTEVLRWPGRMTASQLNAMYGRAVYESDPRRVASATVPTSWWAPYSHLMQYLHPDADPWQEIRIKELLEEHGRSKFDGLDTYAVWS